MSVKRTRVKMCGMTRLDDINYAISLGVDAIGLIFYEKSARYISIAQAKSVLHGIPAFVDTVAVLVNPEQAFVKQLLTELPIQLLQFHGEELPSFCEKFGRPYIKAIPASSKETISSMAKQHPNAAAILLDTPSTNWGGTGLTFDWQVVPQQLRTPIILAGGLDANNIAEAITTCSPYAVDVCSGIESTPGLKDHDKMTAFMNVLRGNE